MAVHSILSRVRDIVKYFGMYNENRHLLLLVLPREHNVIFPDPNLMDIALFHIL